jgi:hypothetical protein
MIRNAFTSTRAAAGMLAMLIVLLLLPVAISFISPPPRIEAYKSISTEAGTAGAVMRTIYQSPPQADIVFLGSSLVSAGVSREMVQTALGGHLHRAAHVQVLAMNWPGLDAQYFMLRDYLNTHSARLLVWNLPEAHARAYDYPQIQAYRWLRFGEYGDALRGLQWHQYIALYGEMVIGAPRELLSIVRSNRVGDEGEELPPTLTRKGYMGSQFVTDDAAPSSEQSARLLPSDAQEVANHGNALGPYQLHFARLIVELARAHNCRIVLLHIPTDAEFNDRSIPELDGWKTTLGPGNQMIGIPSARLFFGMDRSHFNHFYRDTHLNENGQRYFSQAILPALFNAWDQPAASRP